MDEQIQLKIVQLVLAAMSGDLQATQYINLIMQAALQGDQLAAQIAQMILLVAQLMQQLQVRAAKFGAKLNYIKLLKGQCPEGYKMEYYKEGGQLCKKCMKVHQDGGEVKQTPNTIAGLFKMLTGKKMNKKENGGAIEAEKCGGKPKLRKKECGGLMKQNKKKQKGENGMSLKRRPAIDYSGYTLNTSPYEISLEYANDMRLSAKEVENDPEFKMSDDELAWRTNIGKHFNYSIISDNVDIPTDYGGNTDLLMSYDTGKPANLNPNKNLFNNTASQVMANYRKNKGSFFTK